MDPFARPGHALSPPERPEQCELCRRRAPLTKHHLIPRALHNKPRYRKRHSREERLTAILWLCHACHRHIHRLYSERELADQFASREALLASEEVRHFVEWLSHKPDGFKPKSRRPRR